MLLVLVVEDGRYCRGGVYGTDPKAGEDYTF